MESTDDAPVGPRTWTGTGVCTQNVCSVAGSRMLREWTPMCSTDLI